MTAALDRVLGRVTMYALVILCLTLIAVVAFGLSLFDQLNCLHRAELLVSATVLFTFSYLANGIFGVIFRTHPQLSSTAITALILLFVFQPTLDLAGLGGLALAATAAVASKYLFAWRRRHIFNPAAFGAVVVGVTGLAFPSWWVGTPPLLPFVIIGALLVLFRTRRIPLGAAFVVVADRGDDPRLRGHGRHPDPDGAELRAGLVADLVLRRLHAERAPHAAAPPLAADVARGVRRDLRVDPVPASDRPSDADPHQLAAARAAGRQPDRLLLRTAPRHPARPGRASPAHADDLGVQLPAARAGPLRAGPVRRARASAPPHRRAWLAPHVQHRLGPEGGRAAAVRHPVPGALEQLQADAVRPRARQPHHGDRGLRRLRAADRHVAQAAARRGRNRHHAVRRPAASASPTATSATSWSSTSSPRSTTSPTVTNWWPPDAGSS